MVRHLIDSLYVGGAEFGMVDFTPQLKPCRFQFSLSAQTYVDDGPKYLVHGLGNYGRLYRDAEDVADVTLAERALLDVCVAAFEELAAQDPERLREPPPPRYRGVGEPGLLH